MNRLALYFIVLVARVGFAIEVILQMKPIADLRVLRDGTLAIYNLAGTNHVVKLDCEKRE